MRVGLLGSCLTLPVALLWGCVSQDAADRGYTVRDSAGITIVESFAPAWQEGEGWTLSTEPILEIGVVEGEDVYQLDQVRHVVRASDGRIAIVNGGMQQIRVYDAAGRFLRSIGQAGDGPGEFQFLWSVRWRPPDTIVAYDLQLRRMTVFDASSAPVRSFPVGTGPPSGSLVPMGDGGFLWAWTIVRPERIMGDVVRAEAALVRHRPDGTPTDTIGLFPADETAMWEVSGGPRFVGPPLFARRLTFAVRSDTTFVSTGDDYEIRIFGPDHSLLRMIRRPGLDLSVTQTSRDSLMAAMMEALDPGLRETYGRTLAAMPAAKKRASHGDILMDAEGYLWVSASSPDWLPAGSMLPTRWNVFDPEGRWLGEVTVPERFKVFEVGADFVLGVGWDELDVEHVRMYGLVRNGAS